MSYVPPYHYFYNNGKNHYKQANVLPVEAPRRANAFWKNYGFQGLVLGAALALLGSAMIPIEISRIIQGSLNRLKTGSYLLYPNYNRVRNQASSQIQNFIPDVLGNRAADLADAGIVPRNSLGVAGINNFPIQDKYLWPWSHAALLFSLVTVAAGILGILSSCRRTYTSIFAFFVLSLLSGFLSIFLIVYFATHVYWQKQQNDINRLNFYFHNLDHALGVTMLVLSALTCVISFFSTLLACCSAGVCLGRKAPLVKQARKPIKGEPNLEQVAIKNQYNFPRNF